MKRAHAGVASGPLGAPRAREPRRSFPTSGPGGLLELPVGPGNLDAEVTQRRTASRLALTGVATAALLLAHWAAYVLAYRDAGLRVIVLAQSGHSYLASVGKFSLVFFLVALAWLAVDVWDRRRARDNLAFGFRSVALRLLGIQWIGFSALEVVERLIARAPVVEMLSHYTYVLGLLMQVVTALAGAVVVLLLARTVRRVALLLRSRRRPLDRVTTFHHGHQTPIALRRELVGATGVRGPPQTSGF
jgi:hypothetical protein